MFRNVYVEFLLVARACHSVLSSEDSDVHSKEFSGTNEVVLQRQIKLLQLLDAGIFDHYFLLPVRSRHSTFNHYAPQKGNLLFQSLSEWSEAAVWLCLNTQVYSRGCG